MAVARAALAAPPPASCAEGANVQDIALASAIESTYTGNPQLLSVRQDFEKSKAALTGAVTGFLPSATASLVNERFVPLGPGSVPVSVGTTVVGGQIATYSSYPSLGLNWNLFSGGKDVAIYRGASAGVRAAEGDLGDRTNTGLSATLQSYGELLKAQKAAEQLQRAAEMLEQILARAEFRFRQGRENMLTVEQSRVALAQGERLYYESCKTLAEKSSAMSQAIGIRMGPAHLFRAVTDALPVPKAVSASDTDFEKTVEQDPAVRAAFERVEMAQKRVDQMRAAFMPTLSFYARHDDLGQNPNGFGDAFNAIQRNSNRIGITLQQPLGPFTSEYAALESARADLIKAQAGHQAALIDADARLRSAWNSKRLTAQTVEVARRSAERAQEALKVSEQMFSAGRIDQDTVDRLKISAARELQALEERRTDDHLQGWLLFRALNPGDFRQTLMRASGGTGGWNGSYRQ